MALINFVPWPIETEQPQQAALALNQLLTLVGGYHDSNLVLRSAVTASALVQRYAPDAPQDVKDESLIRCVGYLLEQPSGAVRSEAQGDIRTSYMPTHTSALRHSGAMALLSPWKVRRAGAI